VRTLLRHLRLVSVALVVSCGGGGGGAGSGSAGGGGGGGSTSALPPKVLQSPSSLAVSAGQTAQFSVTASGTGTLTYQWRRAGTPIAGATQPVYTTAPVGTLDDGSSFDVVVGDANGSTASGAAVLSVHAPVGGADVLSWHNDAFRTGANLAETALTPQNVNATSFGLRVFLGTDGSVDAQPLYAAQVQTSSGTKNLLVVATENDTIYAFDADAPAAASPVWQAHLIPANEVPGTYTYGGSAPAVPVGITATPLIDRSRGPSGTIYVVAMSRDLTKSPTAYYQRLHALDLATGAEQTSINAAATASPVAIAASYPGIGDNSNGSQVVFDPAQYKERTAVTMVGGVVYTLWAAQNESLPWTGWIIGYDANSLAQVRVLNITPNGSGGAAWNAGAGPAVDTDGSLFYLAGNGTFDANALDANGFPALRNFGNAFVRIATGGGQLAVADYFESVDGPTESGTDVDFGSGGAMLLPDQVDASGTTRRLAVGAGKDGKIYVVDRAGMGKFSTTANLNYQVVSGAFVGGPNGTMFSSPAWFSGRLYYGAVNDAIKAFPLAAARLPPSASQQTATAYGYPGATPSISANGSSNAIVWAVENSASPNACVLHAYDALDLSRELYNNLQVATRDLMLGADAKFIVPTITAGKVFVGTTLGVAVFGLL